jgi:cytochrome c oxidase subunit III
MKDITQTLNAETKPMAMNPRKFAMWLFIVSVVMIFAALTSAYIVKQGEGNWLEYDLPAVFWTNTAIIVLSSVTMQWAYFAAKKDNLDTVKVTLLATTVLGIAFLVGQWLAWGALVEQEVFFVGNPSGSFMYVLTGLHAIHLISAVIFLLVMLIWAFRSKIHSQNRSALEMCTTYWHFLGGLWVYLFIFLLLNR